MQSDEAQRTVEHFLQQKEVITGIFGLAATALGGFLTWIGGRMTSRARRLSELDAYVLKMAEFGMQWPMIENGEFCKKYPDIPDIEQKERYENYCCYVFNVLMMIFKHFKGNREKIINYINVDEILISHHCWWNEDRFNLEQEQAFRNFIHERMDKLRKEKEIP